jgi:hypothetical protein
VRVATLWRGELVGRGALKGHDVKGACGRLGSISTRLGDVDLKEINELEERPGVSLVAVAS